jgi:hypothetical protein
LFTIQGLSLLHDLGRLRHQFKLTFGRRPCRHHQYPACGGARAQEDGTILIRGLLSQPWKRFVHLDLPELIRPREIAESD